MRQSREVFVRTYGSFESGLDVIQKLCPPVAGSVWAATNVVILAADAVRCSKRALVEQLLLQRTQSGLSRNETSYRTVQGFSYKTTSNCVFGWQELSGGKFNFFVRTDQFRFTMFREQMIHRLSVQGFQGFDVRTAVYYVGDLPRF